MKNSGDKDFAYNYPEAYAQLQQIERESAIRHQKAQVDHKYAYHVHSCIKTMEHEREEFCDKIVRVTADTIHKYAPEVVGDYRGRLALGGVNEHPKMKGLFQKYPNFWDKYSEVYQTILIHSREFEYYATRIRECRNIEEADRYAAEMQQWHNNLFKTFNSDVVKMSQIIDDQLKKFFQPQAEAIQAREIDPVINPAHPMELPDNLMKELVELREGLIQKDQIIHDQAGELQHKNIQLEAKEAANQELKADKAELKQDKVDLQRQVDHWQKSDAVKAAKIQELHQKIYEDNIKYLELKTQFDKIISDNQHLAVNPNEVGIMGLEHHNPDMV